ncbi:diaminopimelate decarboxylase [Candidatus Liberibacter americanus]|uniref:Diaminopimelate decarboxylase n=1 Tax=Candidatus Liberibacter americanus str. Sao Paulo TaxID=1261131 RepID=U6B4V6_9HYPH|nr:diaminopimelate decarboxylase [Candidatus Liberibacter americanus]AHA27648.1 Diaminopimelate decarboxylase [Candidatus Liberibacter americanus str. Sao Paulo]EMS36357.1 diaminopimelate decarboxylase protein [Candidatus Liberibacter americanus PW_SP]
MSYFEHCEETLHAEGVSIKKIAQTVKTPFYCYSTAAIEDNYHAFSRAFAGIDVMICYALKANSNQAVIKTITRLGAGLDIVSEGELYRALSANVPGDKIVFSGVGKTVDEIDLAIKSRIYCFNVESESELITISQRAVSLGETASISFRVNPDVNANTHQKISTGKKDDKFGIPLTQIRSLCRYAKTLAGIKLSGIDMHIGSQINQIEAFDKAFKLLRELIQQLISDGHNIKHIDVGGGLGVPYYDSRPSPPSTYDYSQLIRKYFDDLKCKIILEPGRFLVANAGILVTQVISIKNAENKTFIILDTAMNDLIRPTLYSAYHEIKSVVMPDDSCLQVKADLVGPICETGDFLALDRIIPLPKPRDLLYINTAGAYGAVQSGTYNSRLLIPEVLVKGHEFHIVRPRKSFKELINLDSIPKWLK